MSTNTNSNEQNGRQLPLPNRLSLDSRFSNVSEQQKPLCRKFIWGTCTKDAYCKFRHERNLNEMKKILKFCHDYQNKQGCMREECTYLHASKEEQTLFLTSDQLPPALIERYEASKTTHQSSPEMQSSHLSSFEGVPQMPRYLPISSTLLPPPPPPPPQPAPPPVPAPVMGPATAPPPPPEHPMSMSFANVQASTTMFTAPPPRNFPMSQPPPAVVPMFDATRPPPSYTGQSNNGPAKRRCDPCEAGPSKVRKTEVLPDVPCENCVQRKLRIDMYRQQMFELLREELVFKKKYEEYENSKELLRSLVSPEAYRILDDYIESGPEPGLVQNILAQFSQSSYSTTPKQMFHQMMDNVFNPRRNVDLVPSIRFDDDLYQSLSSLPRRQNYASNQSELAQNIIDAIRNSNTTPERSFAMESRTAEALNEANRSNASSATNVNGFNRSTNGRKPETSSQASVSSTSRFPGTSGTQSRIYQEMGLGVAGPSGMSATTSQMVYQPSTNYTAYHPGIPPPGNRYQQFGPTAPTNAPRGLALGNNQMPPGHHQMPPGNHQMTPTNHQMPPGNPQMPPGQHQMPPGQHQMPSGHHQAPNRQSSLPINYGYDQYNMRYYQQQYPPYQ